MPIELVEFQFLGWKFAVARYVSTLVIVVVMSLAIEKVFFAGGWTAEGIAEEHEEIPPEATEEEIMEEMEED